MPDTPWTAAPLVALDLEGTGAQDKDNEAILEIALIPLTEGQPALADRYTTLINPERPILRRPWISPGLTNVTLADAPALATVEPALTDRLNGRLIVGHNIRVDWRLLHSRCPTIHPAGLIDTLTLARRTLPTRTPTSLTALTDRYDLTTHVNTLIPYGQPHRALWDTAATALLLPALIQARWTSPPTLTQLQAAAEIPLDTNPPLTQNNLFDP